MRSWVALGGAVGSLGRVGLGEVVGGASGWPWGTLLVNVTGTLALALLTTRVHDVRLRAALLTGVLGAWTTVSTFAVDVVAMSRGDAVGMAATYVLVTVGSGVLAARVGSGPTSIEPAS